MNPRLTWAKAFVGENFNFFSHTLAGTPELSPRWRRCVHSTDNALGEALGQAYVAAPFRRTAKSACCGS